MPSVEEILSRCGKPAEQKAAPVPTAELVVPPAPEAPQTKPTADAPVNRPSLPEPARLPTPETAREAASAPVAAGNSDRPLTLPATNRPSEPAPAQAPTTAAATPPAPAGTRQQVSVPAPTAPSQPPTHNPAELRIRLCKARELYYAGQIEEARQAALQLRQAAPRAWGRGEDSPEKLLDDIQKAYARRGQEVSAQVLSEARKHLAQGNLDEAEQMAHLADRLHGPYSLFEKWGDRPDRLLAEIAAARAARRKAAAVPFPAPVHAGATTAPTTANTSVAATGPRPPQPASPAPVPFMGKPVENPTPTSAARTSGIVPAAGIVSEGAAPPAAGQGPEIPPMTNPAQIAPSILAPQVPPAPRAGSQTAELSAQAGPKGTPKRNEASSEKKTPPPTTDPGLSKPLPDPVQPVGTVVVEGTTGPIEVEEVPALQLTAGLGYSLLWPYWKNNPAFIVRTAGAVPTARQFDVDHDAQFVPQFTLGLEAGGGLGFRFGWWGFVSAESATTDIGQLATSAAPLGLQVIWSRPGDVLSAATDLKFNVWDFELTERVQLDQWWLLMTGGVRYAHLSQGYIAWVNDARGSLQQQLFSGHNFDGAGPTASITANRWIGGSPLYLYGDLRGSLLFGKSRQSASVVGVPGGPSVADAYTCSHAVLPVGEMELGMGWGREFGSSLLFVRAGMIAQAWFDAGNSSRSTLLPGGAIGESGTSADPLLGLFGFTMRIGLNY
jgi:hypothetical protein